MEDNSLTPQDILKLKVYAYMEKMKGKKKLKEKVAITNVSDDTG